MIWIILGTLIIAGILAAIAHTMVRAIGWKETLTAWAFSALITATAVGASLLIGYGVERL